MLNIFTKTKMDEPIIHDERDENDVIVVDTYTTNNENQTSLMTPRDLYDFPQENHSE